MTDLVFSVIIALLIILVFIPGILMSAVLVHDMKGAGKGVYRGFSFYLLTSGIIKITAAAAGIFYLKHSGNCFITSALVLAMAGGLCLSFIGVKYLRKIAFKNRG